MASCVVVYHPLPSKSKPLLHLNMDDLFASTTFPKMCQGSTHATICLAVLWICLQPLPRPREASRSDKVSFGRPDLDSTRADAGYAPRQSIGPRTGYGIKVIGYNVYFIYRPANVAKLRKYPKVITTPGVITFVLKTLFGMVPTAVDMHTFDKSGIQANARPGSSVKSHNRIDHLTHANFHKHLLGEGLAKVYQGFAVSLLRRLPSLGIDNQWTQHSDLLDFWMLPMTSAMNEALAGPIIECVNPGFAKDLFQYYPYLHSFLKGWLKWLIPEAYRLQKSLIQGVATWHAIARARFHASDIDKTTGYDPCWGSAFMRERQQILRHVDNWDAHSIAASDFGIFWG